MTDLSDGTNLLHKSTGDSEVCESVGGVWEPLMLVTCWKVFDSVETKFLK